MGRRKGLIPVVTGSKPAAGVSSEVPCHTYRSAAPADDASTRRERMPVGPPLSSTPSGVPAPYSHFGSPNCGLILCCPPRAWCRSSASLGRSVAPRKSNGGVGPRDINRFQRCCTASRDVRTRAAMNCDRFPISSSDDEPQLRSVPSRFRAWPAAIWCSQSCSTGGSLACPRHRHLRAARVARKSVHGGHV